jgi:hypothetical protein
LVDEDQVYAAYFSQEIIQALQFGWFDCVITELTVVSPTILRIRVDGVKDPMERACLFITPDFKKRLRKRGEEH